MLKNYDSAVKLFLKNCEVNGLSDETISSYSRTFRYYRDFLVKNEYEEASYTASIEWKAQLNKSISLTTMELYFRHIQYLSDFAVKCKLYGKEDGFMDEDLFPPKKKVSKERHKEYEHVLSEEDVAALMNATHSVYSRTSHTFLREKAVTVLLLTSGLRNIELRNLRLKDLNFEEGYIFAHVTKGDKPRFVPFIGIAKDCINDYLNSGLRPSNLTMDDYLFGVVNRDGRWRQFERTELSELIYRYAKGIIGEEKASRSHSLRHAFASNAYSNQMPLEEISEILGHSDIKTTLIYSKRLNPEKFAAEFGQKFEQIITKEVVAV